MKINQNLIELSKASELILFKIWFSNAIGAWKFSSMGLNIITELKGLLLCNSLFKWPVMCIYEYLY